MDKTSRSKDRRALKIDRSSSSSEKPLHREYFTNTADEHSNNLLIAFSRSIVQRLFNNRVIVPRSQACLSQDGGQESNSGRSCLKRGPKFGGYKI